MLKSTNQGSRWREIYLRDFTIVKLQGHAKEAFYAGTYLEHLFGSHDNGRFSEISDSFGEIVQREGCGIGLIYIAYLNTIGEELWPCNIFMNAEE